MKAPLKDIKKLAQVLLRSKGLYSGEIDGIWGRGSDAAYTGYIDFLNGKGVAIGDEETIVEDPAIEPVTGVVVLDPGHGGKEKLGGSSSNNATSASGVLEKAMTLDLAKLIRKELKALVAETPSLPGSLQSEFHAAAKAQDDPTARQKWQRFLDEFDPKDGYFEDAMHARLVEWAKMEVVRLRYRAKGDTQTEQQQIAKMRRRADATNLR